jgi:two-component system chemotaxis response regulator CheY
VADVLKDERFQIISAVDGVEALNILATTSVDLLLSDLEMPGVDGLELAAAARNLPQHKYLPILMLSTRRAEELPVKRRAPVTGWISKPVDPVLLIRWITRLLPG